MPIQRKCRCGYVCSFFFFQAEDGIRDYKVTGVQTCALPISPVRPAEQAGQLLLGTIDQWNAALVAEASRVVERDHVGVPLDEMGAEVEPGGVVRTANHDATLHDLCRVRGGLAAHHVRVRERPGALQELPVADARREPAVRRRRDRGPRGGGGGGGGGRRLGGSSGRESRDEQKGRVNRTHDPIYRPETRTGPEDTRARFATIGYAQTLRTFCACKPLGP